MDTSHLTFTFVDDSSLRTVLEEYHHQTLATLSSGFHLGAIVGCGSLVEGLLTWALLRKEQPARISGRACKDKQGQVKALQEWNLSNLRDLSGERGWVG